MECYGTRTQGEPGKALKSVVEAPPCVLMRLECDLMHDDDDGRTWDELWRQGEIDGSALHGASSTACTAMYKYSPVQESLLYYYCVLLCFTVPPILFLLLGCSLASFATRTHGQ
jgi:hypothetical protein